ncbi:enoyl-CoA hydratase/isomerase family protein [Bordetella sp. BOR01]|uniref:enoyl-CoA hydratase/isomerase family protein n=1 Tax=Bordetella sp. BOR01 TaxID=2854779 RepID=UPI001C4839FF|nr:enoyl-CoA hydratase/isomerase family protein [Bordetella sp. BOR01]MBV7483575.1 enoyl-CoA hydratase/isomerase family protein [Bordetella sp. BOR01]
MQAASKLYQAIQYVVADNVATLTLNRPAQRNALDQVMRAELGEVVAAIRRDRGIKVLVIQGAGGAFCAGGDISTMMSDTAADGARDRMLNLQIIIADLLNLDRPVIAVVDGPAYGAGVGLALTADLLLASPRARFCLSFLRLGAVPDCGVFYTLPRIVGLQRAKELAFSTREFGAEEARKMGIVFEIHAESQVHQRAQALAASMSQLPLTALSLTKRLFNASLNSDLNTMLDLEAAGQGIARSTAYHGEAAARFMQKHPPLYQWPAAPEAE